MPTNMYKAVDKPNDVKLSFFTMDAGGAFYALGSDEKIYTWQPSTSSWICKVIIEIP